MSKKGLGIHYLIDLYECDSNSLASVADISRIMIVASEIGKLNIVRECFHQFQPYGVSGVLVLKESHFTIHTWPEYKYVSIDLYLCDYNVDVNNIIKYLEKEFRSNRKELTILKRGVSI